MFNLRKVISSEPRRGRGILFGGLFLIGDILPNRVQISVWGSSHLLPREQSSADRANDSVVRGDDDLLVKDASERCRHGIVVGGSPLEEYRVAHVPPADN